MDEKNASISSKKAEPALQVSQKLILTILHDDLHHKPFKLHEWHKLEPCDYTARVELVPYNKLIKQFFLIYILILHLKIIKHIYI